MGWFSKEPAEKEAMFETICALGRRNGHLENQRNLARRKRNVYKKKWRDLGMLYDHLSEENSKLRKERAELKARVIAMEPVYVEATLRKEAS